jgi:predicted small lipoprotein YifL
VLNPCVSISDFSPNSFMRTLTTLALTILLLNACGLKGPLYLPQEPAPEKPPAAQPQKSPDTEKKK